MTSVYVWQQKPVVPIQENMLQNVPSIVANYYENNIITRSTITEEAKRFRIPQRHNKPVSDIDVGSFHISDRQRPDRSR